MFITRNVLLSIGLNDGEDLFKCAERDEVIGFYENNNPVDTWYYFGEKSQILMIEDKKGFNKDKQVKNEDGVSVRPKYESYLKSYNPQTGILKNEGIALYDGDIEIDYFKYGTWKSH